MLHQHMPDYRSNLKLCKLNCAAPPPPPHTHTHTHKGCTQFQALLIWVVATYVGSCLPAFLSNL